MSTILIVEDHFATATALKFLLTRRGYEVEHVACGEAALDHLSKPQLPDLMILDIGLGGIDGREVLRQMRATSRTQTLPVIVFSAVIDDDDRSTLMHTGANECWVKSQTDVDHIIERVGVYLPGATQEPH